jgi:hypothetical protein
MRKVAIILFISTSLAFAQEKISNIDLRGLNKVLSISDKESKFEFTKSSIDQYFLNTIKNKKYTKTKLGNSDFKIFDKFFVKNFIDLKYMMAPAPKTCKVSYELFMRGEQLRVCTKELKKIKRVKLLISKINDIK